MYRQNSVFSYKVEYDVVDQRLDTIHVFHVCRSPHVTAASQICKSHLRQYEDLEGILTQPLLQIVKVKVADLGKEKSNECLPKVVANFFSLWPL